MVADGFLSELRSVIKISEVVGEYVSLRKQGARLVGLCPFHAERSPSFSVSDLKGAYYCFGCQKGGDIIDFIREMQGVSFPESVRILAAKAGVEVPPSFRSKGRAGASSAEMQAAAKPSELELIYKLNRFVAQFYHEQLYAPAGAKAMAYLRDRGLSEETIKSAYLGYSPQGWAELTEFLVNKKAPLELAERVGLIRKKEAPGPDGRQHYDLFRDRVMFPIIDRRGRVAGFGGRRLGDEDGPKYMNSADSPVFQKKEHFYGIFQAQKHIRTLDRTVVVEGYMDCLALTQAGIVDAVATLGTALTDTHIVRLRRLTENIILLFDGDTAGQAAQLKAMESFLDQGLVVKGVALPQGLDPDEYVRKQGAAAMQELLSHAPDLLDQQIMLAKTQAGARPQERAQALDRIIPWLAKLRTPAARLVRLQDLSGHFAVPYALLERQVIALTPAASTKSSAPQNAFGGNAPLRQGPVPRTSAPVRMKIDKMELRFVEFLATNPNLARELHDINELLMHFVDERCRELAACIVNTAKDGKSVDVSMLDEVMSLDSRGLLNRILAAASEQESITTNDNARREWDDLLKRFRRRKFEKEKDRLRQAIQDADAAGRLEDLAQYMQEFNRLQKDLEKETEPTQGV